MKHVRLVEEYELESARIDPFHFRILFARNKRRLDTQLGAQFQRFIARKKEESISLPRVHNGGQKE